MTTKLKVIKDFDKLSDEVVEQIKLVYPRGFRHSNDDNNLVGEIAEGEEIETAKKYDEDL